MSDVRWDEPGWDWDDDDFSWLSSKSGIRENGTSIFFIHGGRIRHQAHIDYGSYPLEEFIGLLRERAQGLDDPIVMWLDDTGGGDPGFWIDGTRPPNEEDLARLDRARQREAEEDAREMAWLQRKQAARARRS